jgi:hypothetical protein
VNWSVNSSNPINTDVQTAVGTAGLDFQTMAALLTTSPGSTQTLLGSTTTLSKAPKTPKKPPGLPPEIDRVLPKWKRVNDAPKGKELITTVNGLYRRAAKGNPNTFDYAGYANDLKAVESTFSNLVTSPVQAREFAAAIKRARSVMPGEEAAPPHMPLARGGSTNDKNPGSAKAGLDADGKNSARKYARGKLVETQPYVPTANGFDGNPNFTRMVGTANSNKLPVYQIKDASNSYVMPIDLSKISLQPIAQRSANGAGATTSKQPNPLYTNSTVTQFADRAVQGRVPGIDPQKLLGAFNSAFFNTYGPETTISLASMVAGKVTSTGKVEPGDKSVLTWDNKTGAASIKSWSANSKGGYQSDYDNKGVMLASPRAVARGFGKDVGNLNANGFVGTNAKTDTSDKSERGTFVGINKAGKLAVLVAGDDMTAAQAVAHLQKAGYGVQVVKLDSGPSSQLSLVTDRKPPIAGDTRPVSRDAETVVSSPIARGTPLTIGIVLK